MAIRNIVTKNIIFPLGEKLSGLSITKNLRFLEESQWWSKAELEEYQNKKLQELVNYAYNNTIYYKDKFNELGLKPSDIKNQKDLYKLPILNKDDIRRNVKNGHIIANNIYSRNIILNSSSGSTGEPLKFYETKWSNAFNKACAIRGWQWFGYDLGDRYVKISQYERAIHKRIQDVLNNSVYLSAQVINDENLSKIVHKINTAKPKVIRSYPDQLKALVSFIQKEELSIYSPKFITTTGSVLHDHDRNNIESVFQCAVFDSYSCEGGANVSECSTHNCYHSSMEYAITEIINENRHAKPGEEGRLITTDLQNYATPFIRYDTQDIVKRSEVDCSCGRKLMAIEKIKGRDSDILITPSGQKLIAIEFGDYFQFIDEVEQFQVIQTKIDHIVFKLKTGKHYDEKTKNKIYEYWKKYIDKDVLLTIEEVDHIPLNDSGKRRYVIRDKNIQLTI